MVRKLFLFYNTIKYLRLSQIYWRLNGKLKRLLYSSHRYQRIYCSDVSPVQYLRNDRRENPGRRAIITKNHFVFLNTVIDTCGDWFPHQASQLWLYNLHYFDYLFEIDSEAEFERLILDWIVRVKPYTKDAWHPYTVSIRVCNWIWNFSRFHQTLSSGFHRSFINSIANQLRYLHDYIEYDVLGNHCIENCKALIIGGVFLEYKKYTRLGINILMRQIKEQVLTDGGHYERSPMYHCIVLEDLVAIWDALEKVNREALNHLRDTIILMAHFLSTILIDKTLPLLNDSTYDVAINPESLLAHIQNKFRVPIPGLTIHNPVLLKDSGIFIYCTPESSLLFDCGKIGPDFLPAHAHNDTLAYILNFSGKEIVTDSGTYEYTAGSWRNYFRSSKAHNCITIAGMETNEIWSSFRVGRRGYPFNYSFDPVAGEVSCSHDSYARIGVFLHRKIRILKSGNGIVVFDNIENRNKPRMFENNIHFSESVIIKKRERVDSVARYTLECEDLTFLVLIQTKSCRIDERKSWCSRYFGEKTERLNLCLNGEAARGNTNTAYAIILNSLTAEADVQLAEQILRA